MIFVDADAYIALNVEEDVNNKRAFAATNQFKDEMLDVVTSWDVIDEVTTKLSRYRAADVGRAFLKDILTSDTRIEYMNPLRATLARDLFVKQTSKKVSLTDCANMVIARSLGVKTFFSFDHHYEQNGFTLLAKQR